MAMKKKLTKEEFAKLPEAFKAEYIEDGDGFRLDVTGDEDTGALKRAKDREAQLRRDAEAKLRDAQEQLDALGNDDARKKGDIATLEKAWQKKLDDATAESTGKISKLTAHTTKTLLDGTAHQIAAKISTVPGLMAKAIRERLAVDFEGDEPTLRILDAAGKPSTLTLEQLSQEFVANKEFSSIIVGSKASGGGAAKDGFAKRNGGATQNDDSNKPANLATMNPRALAEQIKANREANKE
ncbi:MAG: hypothetical protein A2Y38_12865 [Spirochaetes bacterium GWB1_59_5]|nr:MAG: hypothetical protein A2Y38_12865 [Spirochaetes bacterium GWB1_59_5]